MRTLDLANKLQVIIDHLAQGDGISTTIVELQEIIKELRAEYDSKLS